MKKRGKIEGNKKGLMPLEYVAYIIIALVFLAIMIAGYLYLKKSDTGAISFIKNLFRFGRGG